MNITRTLLAVAACAATSAWAQTSTPAPAPAPAPATAVPNSVTLYGAIDAAVVWIDKVASGSSLTKVDTAGNWANRWGLRGREDLGDGLAAVFTIEAGFDSDTGALGQGGLAFGRQSFVGLNHRTYGTLTFGRQYDFVYAIPPDIVMVIGGLAGAVGGGSVVADMHLGGTRYDNTAKWIGEFGPVRVGGMWGLGRENDTDKMASAMLAYRQGPVNAGIAYTRDNYLPLAPFVASNEVLVATAHYDITPEYKLIGLLGKARARLAADSNSSNRLAEVGLIQKLAPTWSLGYVYGQASIRNAANAPGKVREIGLGTYYDFSRRTTVYGIVTSVNSSGSAGTAYSSAPGIGGPITVNRSNTDRQNVVKFGIRHFF